MTKRKPEFVDPVEAHWYQHHPKFPGVAECVRLLRLGSARGSRLDIITFELEKHAPETLDELIAEVRNPVNDSHTRELLMGVLAKVALPASTPFLIECLQSPDENVRYWSERGLDKIGTKEARTALWPFRSSRGARNQ